MKFGFLIYSYFPFGGQQRDFFRITEEILSRGHSVDVYTMSWDGDIPEDINLILVPVKGFNRLKRYERFTTWVAKALDSTNTDCVVGFNKMPLLDIYFAADPCFLEKADTQRGAYYKYTGRYRHFKNYENEVFGKSSQTESLLLSPQQIAAFKKYYPGCENRLHQLPPGISQDRSVEKRDPEVRQRIRQELGIAEDVILVLQIGSGFRVKGVDRSLAAIAALPPAMKEQVHFLLIGQDRSNRFHRLASKLGLKSKVTILAGRSDVPDLLQAADLMLHPAYSESAGYVLLEATVSGLPILTTASCGYAFHIERAESGLVCPLPFEQQILNQMLIEMLDSLQSSPWSANGISYGKTADLYRMPIVAADFIESHGRKLLSSRSSSVPST